MGKSNKVMFTSIGSFTKYIYKSKFLPKTATTSLLYFKFQVVQLKDMVKIKIAKFMFRFKNKMLPNSVNNYFNNHSEIHKYYSRQKAKSGYYHHLFNSEFGRKRLNHECLKLWELISLVEKKCSFSKFKNVFKDNILNYYFENL